MRVIQLSATAGPDGNIRLDIPVGQAGVYEVRVELAPKPAAADSGRPPTPEELGWPPGYFERTAGSLPNFSIEPRYGGQAEQAEREEL